MDDRKALKQQYLEVRSRAGIYAIHCLATGRALVASSANVEGTLNRHRFELRLGQHRNAQLRQDWREHGEACFVFEVVDRVKPREEPSFNEAAELQSLQALWREEFASRGRSAYGGTAGAS